MTLFRDRFRIETTRLSRWDYTGPGWYFVTICTQGRKSFLGSVKDGAVTLSKAGIIAHSEMDILPSRYVNVTIDRFVVMPNHVHALLVIDRRHRYSPTTFIGSTAVGDAASRVSTSLFGKIGAASLANVVGSYKAGVSRICRERGIVEFAWQARFYDRILSSNAAVSAVRDYILNNPQNWQSDPDNEATARAV